MTLSRVQMWASGGVLAVLVATAGGVAAMARNERIVDWMDAGRQEHWRHTNTLYVHKQAFVDLGSRILLRDLPAADHTRGGVYFFGTSKVASFLKTWELPPHLQSRVHNYAMGGSIPVHQHNLVRYLVEREGMLEAGPDQVMVVLGLFWGDAEDPTKGGRPFVNSLTRYGTHTYDTVDGLRNTDAVWNPLLSRLGVATNFLRTVWESVGFDRRQRLRVRPLFRSTERHEPDFYRDKWGQAMGRDWRANMEAQLAALRETVRYLGDRGVEVHLVLLPDPSWFADMPYRAVYADRSRELSESEGIPLHDMTDLLGDDGFADHAHANHTGARTTHAALMKLATDFLQRDGRARP